MMKRTATTGHAGPIALGNEAKRLTDYGNRVEQIRTANREAEQFARLKEAAKAALENIQGIMDGTDIPSIVVRDMLRVALAYPVETSIQCADCLTLIDRDANHTCKAQVRRNKRNR